MAEPKLNGMAGLFDTADDIVAAAEKVRHVGYRKWDCHSPYPVHGLDAAMGIKDSMVPGITLAAGFIGLVLGIVLTGGLNAWYYPIRIGGKAMFSWQAFTPIWFECFVLAAGIANLAAYIILGKLLRWHSPLHDAGLMKEVTCNRFAVVLDARDPMFTEEEARKLLEEAGCKEIHRLEDPAEEEKVFA